MADVKDILVPDIGDFEGVEVIEIMVSAGDAIGVEDPLVSLESDKAAMEIPSEVAGTVKAVKVNFGDKVSQGDPILTLEVSGEAAPAEAQAVTAPVAEEPVAAPQTEAPAPAPAPRAEPPVAHRPPPVPATNIDETAFSKAHASPAVRKFARELGADLGERNVVDAVAAGLERHQLAPYVGVCLVVDILQIGRLATQRRSIVDDL